ncbi:hypothetical protein [Halorussus ruber]|uniref:hypothetical protein n=1 Tax=Halorussus ruber TaxID=1126238 RepID=UPI0010924CE6|nr:hypothetical protein [Halorussus ruber]
MVLSMVAMSGAVLGADVQRGGNQPTFNPGVGGPNDVVVSEQKPVVFQGEDNVDFVTENGEQVNPANLIGVSGNAEGIPLESPIPEDQELGQYAIDGRAANIGVTVQTPRVTDLEVFNTRGVDVEGSTVQEDETLLISAEWNFQRAEDLSLEVTDEDGNEITGDVLTQVDDLSEQQRQRLQGPYAGNPELVENPGQRGTETGIEYLQGLGQLNETEGQPTEDLEAAYWAIDLSDQDAGDYTITVEGWDELDSGAATRSTVISVTGDDNPVLDLDNDEATRGQNVKYTVRGSTAGATHIVTIEDTDFRNNQVDERVFRDVEDVIDRGSFDTNDDGRDDFAWAQVEIDDDTGLGVGQLDTTYLDDTSVDVNLYDADQNVSEVAADLGDTEDDFSLDVREGVLNIDSPAGTYIAGQEVDVRGTAAPGVDDVAVYVRDQGDWELVDINEDGELSQSDFISVDADGEWEERDVRLSQANDILSIPGRYRLGVVEAVDVTQNGEVAETLTTSEFSSATSEQSSIIVTEPTLGGTGGNSSLAAAFGDAPPMTFQNQQQNDTQERNPTYVFRTYNEQIAVEDGTVEVTGVAPGLDEVLVVMIDSRGRTVTETVSVDDNDIFEEDDIELVTRDGRQLNEGQIRGMVIGLGRDAVVGDGVLPGVDDADIASLESWITSFGAGLTQEQVTERITDETTDEAGSDDLILTQNFRYADAATSVTAIAPQNQAGQPTGTAFRTDVTPIEVGQTMTIQGVTNRRPDDNTITVEVIDGPSAAEFDSAATDEWGRTGVWSVNLTAENVEPGTYTLEVDDGDNTDIVQFEVVPEGEGQQDGAQNETTTTTTTTNETEAGGNETTTTTAEGNETGAAENGDDDAGNETDAAANQTDEGQLPNTLEVQRGDNPLNYSVSVNGNIEPGDDTESSDTVEGQTATGQLGVNDQSDTWRFAGQISDVSAEGDLSNATFVLNGEEVSPQELVNATEGNSSAVAPPAVGA